jgi:hypothetical protein
MHAARLAFPKSIAKNRGQTPDFGNELEDIAKIRGLTPV